MEIQEETPIYKDGESQYTLLRYAAMAAKWKEPPRDALDTLTLGAVRTRLYLSVLDLKTTFQVDMVSLDEVEQDVYMPFDPVVKRTEGTLRRKGTTQQFKTTKGAPHVILKLVTLFESNHSASLTLGWYFVGCLQSI